MPRHKDLKRLVRTRMRKTGESYTAARAQLLTPPPHPPADYPRITGISNDAVKRKTGASWRQWVGVLDRLDATNMSHRDIARHLHQVHGLSGWWSQSVTVGYERIRGLREPNQRRGGGFDCNKSKTFGVPVQTLYRAFSDKRRRIRWLDVDLTIRTSRTDQSMRIRWDDDTPVDVHFTAKTPRKSTVTIQHRELKDRAELEQRRAFWTERLAALRHQFG